MEKIQQLEQSGGIQPYPIESPLVPNLDDDYLFEEMNRYKQCCRSLGITKRQLQMETLIQNRLDGITDSEEIPESAKTIDNCMEEVYMSTIQSQTSGYTETEESITDTYAVQVMQATQESQMDDIDHDTISQQLYYKDKTIADLRQNLIMAQLEKRQIELKLNSEKLEFQNQVKDLIIVIQNHEKTINHIQTQNETLQAKILQMNKNLAKQKLKDAQSLSTQPHSQPQTASCTKYKNINDEKYQCSKFMSDYNTNERLREPQTFNAQNEQNDKQQIIYINDETKQQIKKYQNIQSARVMRRYKSILGNDQIFYSKKILSQKQNNKRIMPISIHSPSEIFYSGNQHQTRDSNYLLPPKRSYLQNKKKQIKYDPKYNQIIK